MSGKPNDVSESDSAISTRKLEIIVAFGFLMLAATVMWSCLKLGIDWGDDGPQSGYFPFYVALLMSVATILNLLQIFKKSDTSSFVSKTELKLVLSIFLPCVVYLIAMQYLGIYLASALFISAFMFWQGKFSILKSSVCGISVSVILFIMFEIIFKVALIKGPLEAALGY